MSKGRTQDWEEEFDDTTYDKQYNDGSDSGGVQLNHNCLYITNIPQVMTREGLQTAFKKYGVVTRTFLNTDPHKRYALITFETPGEAKLAMMKLNQTEPLRLNINISHSKAHKRFNNHGDSDRRHNNGDRRHNDVDRRHNDVDRRHNDVDRRQSNQRAGSYRDDDGSVTSHGRHTRTKEEMQMSKLEDEYDEECEDDFGLEASMDPDLHLELERLKFEHLKLQEAQVQCKQRMLLLNSKKPFASMSGNTNRSILPDGRRIIVHNQSDKNEADNLASGAGDSKERGTVSCKPKVEWWEGRSSSDDGTSTPSTCVLCSEDRSDRTDGRDKTQPSTKCRTKSTNATSKFVASKTDLTSKSGYSKVTGTSKASEHTSKRVCMRRVRRSEGTCEFKYSDLYSDSDEDETNRLIEMRGNDYSDIVEDHLRVVVALAGYPKSKMRLQQFEMFHRSLNDVMDMQLKAGLLKRMPTFLDYYLNRGAVVCICKDVDTRDWVVRISPGLQERMANNLILLKAKVKRLCLATLKIPDSCWPTTAQDAFRLLQYFNPSLRTNMWKIYAQKTVGNLECTSFLLDRVSGEIVRGPSFKNIIDYNQMEFELAGYSEIYYECLLSGMDEDLRSVASRVKVLEELRSGDSTPRNTVTIENETATVGTTKKDEQEKEKEDSEDGVEVEYLVETAPVKEEIVVPDKTPTEEIKKDLEHSLQKDILKKLKDVKYISEKDEVIVWNEENKLFESEQEMNVKVTESNTKYTDLNDLDKSNEVSKLAYVDLENTESIYDSYETLLSRNSNVNIDSNRGTAYYRRTNYLHVENELKIAITLADYPQNKLEGTHIRRLKQLFKEYLHKDMKSQRFANLIIPKFQDVYLSNGAVIYICDSLETMDYIKEVLPKFVNATGLRLVFRDVKDLVRYTRTVMRLPEKFAHVESVEILNKLQNSYPNLKPDCWKYYSDVAGKQKRQFGVDPESLEVMRRADFDPTYEGEKISFRIIDRRKRDVSFDETKVDTENNQGIKMKEQIIKLMYSPIEYDVMNASLTRVRTNHYTDLIPDDFKLYVGPANYPETRIDETLFHTIKRTLENVVFETVNEADLNSVPVIHDMYLFDGVIFIICKDLNSRKWIENSLGAVNSKMQSNLKATEFRGAVGIVSMAVKTDKGTDDVIEILQAQNPRLRTKFWRKISTVRATNKLDVVLQIDKLSAQVINEEDFNRFVGNNPVQFALGHLQSLIKRGPSLNTNIKTNKADVEKESINKSIDLDSKEDCKQKTCYNPNLDPKIINDSPKSFEDLIYDLGSNDYCRTILKIPPAVHPANKDDLNIIFDLLQDKNPGLNTELWRITDADYSKGEFVLLTDVQSAAVIRGKNFDPYLAGEKMKFACVDHS